MSQESNIYTFKDWYDSKVIYFNGQFILNPFPKKGNKKSGEINFIISLPEITPVNIQSTELLKIDNWRITNHEFGVESVFSTMVSGFSTDFNITSDQFQYVTSILYQWESLLNQELLEIYDANAIVLKIAEKHFSGFEIEQIRLIYAERHIQGIKTYNHIHPVSSPFFAENIYNLSVRVDAIIKFVNWLRGLKQLYEQQLNGIFTSAHFPSVNPLMDDYLNFFSGYYVNSVYLNFGCAFLSLSNYPGLYKTDTDEADFHKQIIFRISEEFKKKISSEITSNHDPEQCTKIISQTCRSLRKTLIRSKNRGRIFLEQNSRDALFNSSTRIYEVLENLLMYIEDEYSYFIDKMQVAPGDFYKLGSIILEHFQTKNQNLYDTAFNKEEIHNSCSQMRSEYIEEFQYCYEVFLKHWLLKNQYNGKPLTEQGFIRDIMRSVDLDFLNFEVRNKKIAVEDESKKRYSFDAEFYRLYPLMVYVKIHAILKDKLHEITDFDNEPAIPKIIGYKVEQPDEKKQNRSFTIKPGGRLPKTITGLLNDCCDRLRTEKYKFIDAKTNQKFFRKIFSGEIILANEKISWTSSLSELRYFISLLYKKYQVVEKVSGGFWQVAAKCFTYKGTAITGPQIKNNREALLPERESYLNKIVQDLKATPTR